MSHRGFIFTDAFQFIHKDEYAMWMWTNFPNILDGNIFTGIYLLMLGLIIFTSSALAYVHMEIISLRIRT